MSKNAEVRGSVLGCLGLVPAAIIGVFLRGWAIVTLWAWFITPTWHVSPPSASVAVGIATLVGAVIQIPSPKDDPDPDESVGAVLLLAYGKLLLTPVGSVAFGWAVKNWMAV